MQLTPAQLQQLESTNIANIIRKLASGKTLTKSENDLLARHKEASSEESKFVSTWDDLAALLGRSRRTLQKWRDRFGKKCPKDRPDGRKSIAAWRKFMIDHNLAEEPDEPDDNEPKKSDWDRERSRIEFQSALFRLEKDRGKHVELGEICAAVGQMLAGFRTAVNMLPGSAARWLIGLKDFHSIKARLQTEVDGVLQSLGRHEYMHDLAPKVVERQFPNETLEFREKLSKGLEECFIEWGRTALTDLMQREFVECPPPAG